MENLKCANLCRGFFLISYKDNLRRVWRAPGLITDYLGGKISFKSSEALTEKRLTIFEIKLSRGRNLIL